MKLHLMAHGIRLGEFSLCWYDDWAHRFGLEFMYRGYGVIIGFGEHWRMVRPVKYRLTEEV